MSFLITVSRASELIPNYNTADNAVLTDCVAAASDTIERYCNRTFAVTSYDELQDGTGYANLLLDNYPVVTVSRVMAFLAPVVMVRYQNTAASSALVRLDSNSLYLTTIIAGVTATTTLTRSNYATLADLATAISLVSGWTATALGNYSGYPVSDLRAPQGAFDCRWSGAVYLKLHAVPVWDFLSRPEIGELIINWGTPKGNLNYRIIYTAGFSDSSGNTLIPNPIQQACAELAVAVFNNRGMNANLQSESLGGYSYSAIAEKSFDNLSAASKVALEQYKSRRMVRFKLQ